MNFAAIKSNFLKFLKGFLVFAKIAAPVAAEVAVATGHADVVGDINKAGAAANMLDRAVDQID